MSCKKALKTRSDPRVDRRDCQLDGELAAVAAQGWQFDTAVDNRALAGSEELAQAAHMRLAISELG